MVREGVKNPHPDPRFQKEPPILGNLPFLKNPDTHPTLTHHPSSSLKIFQET